MFIGHVPVGFDTTVVPSPRITPGITPRIATGKILCTIDDGSFGHDRLGPVHVRAHVTVANVVQCNSRVVRVSIFVTRCWRSNNENEEDGFYLARLSLLSSLGLRSFLVESRSR